MDIISTRQVAEILAVSEATVKRWADAGTLRCFRTPGGHRKFRMEDVADFLRVYQYESAGPMPDMAGHTSHSITGGTLSEPDPEAPAQFRNAALAGDVDGLVSQIATSRLRGMTLATIFDRVMTPALADVGERWARGVLTVTQEHIAAAAVVEALARTRPLIDRPTRERGKVILGCPGDEQHDIALRMASLLAYGIGYMPVLIGARAPVADLCLVVTAERPKFVVVSASSATNAANAARDLGTIAEAARSVGAGVIAGGHGYDGMTAPPPGVRMMSSMSDLLSMMQGD